MEIVHAISFLLLGIENVPSLLLAQRRLSYVTKSSSEGLKRNEDWAPRVLQGKWFSAGKLSHRKITIHIPTINQIVCFHSYAKEKRDVKKTTHEAGVRLHSHSVRMSIRNAKFIFRDIKKVVKLQRTCLECLLATWVVRSCYRIFSFFFIKFTA